MQEYYTKVSMDVAVMANSPEEATEQLNDWLDRQQLIDKSIEDDLWWDNIDWDDWAIVNTGEEA